MIVLIIVVVAVVVGSVIANEIRANRRPDLAHVNSRPAVRMPDTFMTRGK